MASDPIDLAAIRLHIANKHPYGSHELLERLLELVEEANNWQHRAANLLSRLRGLRDDTREIDGLIEDHAAWLRRVKT